MMKRILRIAVISILFASIPLRVFALPEDESTLSGELTMIMVGDMLMHDSVVRSGLQEDGSYCYDHLFAHVKDTVESADIALVNQETILGGKELKYSGYPTFNSPFELGDAEIKAGFDVILQGTNHALDRGALGIERCLEYWDITHPEAVITGIHDSAEDQEKLRIVEEGGIKIAILNYTYGTNGIQMPKGKGYLVDYLDEERVKSDLARAESLADFTVVCPHWGIEYRLTSSADQERWAAFFVENGADLVIGTHPHVIEPVEILEREDGKEVPVYYSLGNFVNSTSGKGSGVMNRSVGGMALVTLVKNPDGAVLVKEASVKPLICHRTDEEITVFFLEDYTEELSLKNRIKSRDSSFSLKACLDLVSRVWPELNISLLKEVP
ncbi:MAG: CapA family protein [Lachnospiraceae bacterium]|nr:CapA family protein [Lachnospiraceae bacterium]